MKRIDWLYFLSLFAVVGSMGFLVIINIFQGYQVSNLTACLITAGVLGFFAFTLFYLRVRLLPIAYPALYRKDRDE